MAEKVQLYGKNQYNAGVMVDEYNGVYSICAAYESKSGIIVKKWGFPQKGKEPIDKAIPWKIDLGQGEDALDTLKSIAWEIKRRMANPQKSGSPQQGKGEDSPF